VTESSSKLGRVLVTGASGFVGQHLVAALLDLGFAVVACPGPRELAKELRERCDRLVPGDICDPHVQADALEGVCAVCHLAAYIPERMADHRETLQCHLVNAHATLELGLKASEQGVRRFVHMSSGGIYAASDQPRYETDALYPTECGIGYMASKLSAELYLTDIGRRTPMEVVMLRLGTPYGPGEPPQKVIPTFLRLAEQGKPLCLAKGGLARFNFVYIHDVVGCLLAALSKGPAGIYNLASGEHASLRELAEAVVALFPGREVQLHVEPEVQGAFKGLPPLAIDKARLTWGFNPRPLAVGLQEYKLFLERERDGL